MFSDHAEQFLAATENHDTIASVLDELWLSAEEKQLVQDHLVEYVYVEAVEELRCGQTVRWIDVSSLPAASQGLHGPAAVNNVSFTDETLVVKTFMHRVYRIDFNQNLVFRKVSARELSRQRVASHFAADHYDDDEVED
jgi:hypothetical protein